MLKCGALAALCGVCERGVSPPIYTSCRSVWVPILGRPACNRHGETTRECHMAARGERCEEGADRPLGSAAPFWSLHATTFSLVVPCRLGLRPCGFGTYM
jgi:hypothetical protein